MSTVKLSLEQIRAIKAMAEAVYDRLCLAALGIERKSYCVGFIDGMRENINDYKTAERARKRAAANHTTEP